MNMEEQDPNDTYYPWRCKCGRINKKYALECAVCWASWTEGSRHPTRPKIKETQEWDAYKWEEWDEDASWASSRSSSRSATRYRQDGYPNAQSSQQKPIKKGKGKGKVKGKKGKAPNQGGQSDQVSPFQQGDGFAPWTTMDTSRFTPSTTLPTSPFATQMPMSTASDKQEWVEHLKKAYPDPTSMPEDTKLFLEKAEQESGRMGIKNLHQATKYLGKVKKHLGEVTEQRRSHRALWMAHLSNGIKLWEKQLEEFRRHQAMLTEQAGKASAEISATSRIIHQLSSTAAGEAAPPLPQTHTEPEDATEDQADREEEVPRKQLQGVLQSCASSLGLDMTPQKPIEIKEDEEAEEGDKRSKRPRSLEPFPSSAKK